MSLAQMTSQRPFNKRHTLSKATPTCRSAPVVSHAGVGVEGGADAQPAAVAPGVEHGGRLRGRPCHTARLEHGVLQGRTRSRPGGPHHPEGRIIWRARLVSGSMTQAAGVACTRAVGAREMMMPARVCVKSLFSCRVFIFKVTGPSP
jgi:hypothetical protein